MGRRWGKTVLGGKLAIDALNHGAPVAWFSPTYKMLIEVWRDLKLRLHDAIARSSIQERRIELLTGGVLEMWSLDDINAGRGRKYARAIVDEAAMVSNLMDTWNAAIRPTLADYQGDAWFLSTPKGRNAFWQMWQWGQDAQYHEWQSWQMPTLRNPYIVPSEVEAMRLSLPERIYQQEVEAAFLEDGGGVFRRVADAATAEQLDVGRVGPYIVGVDWGKHNDFTVIVVFDASTRSQVYLDRFNQIDYAVQVQRLQVVCDKFRPAAIIAERNSMGEPLVELLHRKGLPIRPFLTTNATKTEAIDALSLAFERGDIRILNDATQVAELQAYEMERLPSGLMRYGAPEGMHDDCVMSLALAWQGVISTSKPRKRSREY